MRRLLLGVDPTHDVLAELGEEARSGGWAEDGLCQRIDPDLWFPEHGHRPKEPIRLCHTCPVMAECRADAFANDERFGIWGGLTERQRLQVSGRLEGGVRRSLIAALAHVDGLPADVDNSEDERTEEQAA